MSRCSVFTWIGQSFAHCDDCGRPFWEHTHRHGQADSPFGGSLPVVEITPEEAEAVRRKWDR